MEEKLQVSETLRGAHPLVSQTLHAMEHVERNANGILQRPKQDSLDVAVSRGNQARFLHCSASGNRVSEYSRLQCGRMKVSLASTQRSLVQTTGE